MKQPAVLLVLLLGCQAPGKDSMTAAQHLQAEQISLAGKRAAELTRQLLAFSRKQPATPRHLNLNEVIQEAEVMLKNDKGN